MSKNTQGKMFTTEKLTILALLTALQVVLGNLIQIPLLGKQFNFGYLPIIAAGGQCSTCRQSA